MQRLAACVLIGSYGLQWLPTLPPAVVAWGLLLLAVALSVIRRTRTLSFMMLGFSVMAIAADRELDDRLAPSLEGRDLVLTVRITSFPDVVGDTVSFVARPLAGGEWPSRLRISWYETDARPAAGETWQLHLRLRRPGGLMNPGGFDVEAWLFREQIGATGYVLAERHNYRLRGATRPWLDRLRSNVLGRLEDRLVADRASAVMMAIAVGARQHLDGDAWDLFAATGTSHLMAISGLHIGLAAGFAFLLVNVTVTPFSRQRPGRDIATLAAVAAAGAYALLSGLAIPAFRALAMVALGATLLLLRRRIRPLDLLAAVLLIVFLSQPLSVLTPGFKLSFAAVGVLMSAIRTYQPTSAAVVARYGSVVRRLVVLQGYLLFSLLPLTVSEFGRVSLLAPLANLLALPIFNLFIVPLTLGGLLVVEALPMIGGIMIDGAHAGIRAVLTILETLAAIPGLSRQPAASPAWVMLLPLAVVCLPPGWPGRGIAVVSLVVIVTGRPEPPRPGCITVQVLDAGQGLAVLVRTAGHSLLYDTGPAFRSGSSIAERVISPFLAHIGEGSADLMVVSHADLDHAGGAAVLLDAGQVRAVMAGEAIDGLPARLCTDGDAWVWDGVTFGILHPRPATPWTGNNASCVLEVSVGDHRVLLPGDIEWPVERLLHYRSVWKPVRVVVVPHHGSRTSSSDALVTAITPDLAIVSAASRNRWGFPRPDVVARWQNAGARVLSTATSGAIEVGLCADGRLTVDEYRSKARRYWHDRRPVRPRIAEK